jgi:Fic family protein
MNKDVIMRKNPTMAIVANKISYIVLFISIITFNHVKPESHNMFKPERIIVSQDLQQLIDKINAFNISWNIIPEQFKTLRHIATIESIGSSTRIEGVKLSDREVEILLSHLTSQPFKSSDEEEVAGYAYVMGEVFNNYEHIPLTENYIKQLHAMLLKYSTKDIRHAGDYKKHPNNVEAFDTQGKSLGIVFATSSPFDTPRDMEQLITWTNNALNTHTIHPLIAIGTFIVSFLAIHPFTDGNGRLSRILTTLLLLKSGYTYIPYSSLESIIEHSKEGYYRALRQTQATLKTENPDFKPWLLYFLRSLDKQINRLELKINHERITHASLPPLAAEILQLVQNKIRVAMADIVEATNAPRSTIKRHLNLLVDQKYLTRHGKGRTVWYTQT